MSENEVALLMFKGVLADLDEANRGSFDGACNAIRAIVEERGDMGKLALGYMGLVVSVEDEGK